MNIAVRTATLDDVPLLVDGNERLAWESEHKRLNRETLEPGIAALVQDTAKGRYFVAEVDGQPAGQVMVTYEWSDWRNGFIWWIQSVYVWAEYRKQGIFRTLFEHLQRTAIESEEVVGLRLYVEKDNTPAQAVYRKLGMIEPGYFVLESMFHGGVGD